MFPRRIQSSILRCMMNCKTHLVPLSVIKTIDQNELFSHGERVLIAFSGGPDSTALVHILNRLKGRYGISLHLAYLNHNLRGTESVSEQDFVERTATALDLPLIERRLTANEVDEVLQGSVEARARSVRLAFLKDAANALGADKIATGHTFDDQVETLLMRLFTGAGPEGFAGMSVSSEGIVRPLIDTHKAQLMNYLSNRGIGYVLDSSNQSEKFLRNKVRHTLIPTILDIFGDHSLVKVSRLARAIEKESQIMGRIASEAYKEALVEKDGSPALSVEHLRRMASALRFRVFRLALSEVGLTGQDTRYENLVSVDAVVLSRNPEAMTDLPGDVALERRGDTVHFSGGHIRRALGPFQMELPVPGCISVEAAEVAIAAEVVPSPNDGPSGSADLVMLDAGFCLERGQKLTVRSVKSEDVFQPLGMQCSVQVREFLKKQKTPSTERKNHPLVLRPDGTVLWVVGKRINHEARIRPDTLSALLLTRRRI